MSRAVAVEIDTDRVLVMRIVRLGDEHSRQAGARRHAASGGLDFGDVEGLADDLDFDVAGQPYRFRSWRVLGTRLAARGQPPSVRKSPTVCLPPVRPPSDIGP